MMRWWCWYSGSRALSPSGDRWLRLGRGVLCGHNRIKGELCPPGPTQDICNKRAGPRAPSLHPGLWGARGLGRDREEARAEGGGPAPCLGEDRG